MTGIDGAITLTPQSRQPLDGPLPDVLMTFDAEYFVEWQVADISPVSGFAAWET